MEKKRSDGRKLPKNEIILEKDFPSLGHLVRALSGGQFNAAIGAMKELKNEIGQKSPESAKEEIADDTGRIGQMLEELEKAKEPLTFIMEVFEGGGAVQVPYIAAETFYNMAEKALDTVKEAMEYGNIGLKEAGAEAQS